MLNPPSPVPGQGGPRTPGAAARASLPARRTQYVDDLEVVEPDAAHEEEQLDVGLRAIAPLADCVELAAGYTWLPGWLP